MTTATFSLYPELVNQVWDFVPLFLYGAFRFVDEHSYRFFYYDTACYKEQNQNRRSPQSTLIHKQCVSLGVCFVVQIIRYAKDCFIGAGSTVFAKNLLGDILSTPELSDSEICLQDIDSSRLETSRIVKRKSVQP